MNKNKDMLLKLLSMGLVLAIPFGLSAQDLPEDPPPPPSEDVPEDPPPPPPEDPPEDPPPPPEEEDPDLPETDQPPQAVLDFLALRSEFLSVVQGEYETGQDRAQAITDWLAENGPAIDDLEEAQEAADLAGDSIDLPEDTIPGERPGPSGNMVDLETLLEDKLYAVANENEALKEALETAELDRQARLDALMEARDARLADIEAAREAARQKRDEARENSGDRRADDDLDDLPGGG